MVFLVATFFLGLGIKIFHGADPVRPSFDYRASDSEFAARSTLSSIADSGEGQSADTSVSRPASVQKKLQMSVSPGEKKRTSGNVNINTANRDELMTLPTIGEAMAARIIDYRTQHGPFKSIADIKKVKGIGKMKFEKLAPFITVSD